MIVSKVPRVGHAAREILPTLFVLFVWDIAVTVFYLKVVPDMRQLELPFSLFGTAIALFIGFAVNASYARWWEARGAWGLMINASRSLARQALTLPSDPTALALEMHEQDAPRTIVRRQIGFVHVLRTALRGEPLPEEASVYLPEGLRARFAEKANKPNAILTSIGELAGHAQRCGLLDPYARVRIESTLVDISNAQGIMERIKNTPLPSQYRFFPSIFSKIFCVILPFAVAQNLGLYTPIGSTLVSIMFLFAVQVGRDLMDPFANDIYDVPMTAITRNIEIDLLQMMNDPAPAKIEPEDGVLW